MLSGMVILGLSAFLVAWTIYRMISQHKHGKSIYELKTSVNGIRWVVHLVVALYAIMGSLVIVPSINAWALDRLASSTVSNPWVYQIAPYVWIITVYWFAVWFIVQGGKPWWKYTEKETAWLKESQAKNNAWLKKLFRINSVSKI